jgi:F-type H+-transporting ATPase subunit b
MLIDWFTVSAQAVNFLLLVWLLRRYLYRPVLAAIDAREQKIAAKLADAAARESEAQLERERLRKQNEAFELERTGLLRKASDEAMAERQRLLEAARQDSDQLHVRLGQALASERAELRRQLSSQAQAEVLAVARGALSDLAGTSLEARMVDVFVERLRALPEARRRPIAAVTEVAPAGAGEALIRSAFILGAASQATIAGAVHAHLGQNMALRFQVSPEIVCGIELTLNGTRLAWSIGDYLDALTAGVAALRDADAATAAPRESQHAHG